MPDLLAPTSRARRAGELLADHRELAIGAAILLVVVGAAVLLPSLLSTDPFEVDAASRYLPPGSPDHLLGTDSRGRDLLARLLVGIQSSLIVACISVAVSATVGSALGIVSGFFKGVFDSVVMRIVDVFFAFPVMLLALLMIAVLGSSTSTVVMAISVVFIPYFVRVARASTLGQMSETYTMMLRSAGASHTRLMFRHVLPNIASPLTVQAAVAMTWAITVEAALSYLGLGQQPPNPSIGSMISDGQAVLMISPWVSLVPAIALIVIILALNLVGDGLRDALDPRRKR